MFKSATFKLTIWYLAIAMAISILFSFALYDVTTSELSRGLNRESQNLYSRFPVFQDDPDDGFQPGPYYQNSAHRLLIKLISYNVLVLFGAGFSSYALARRTLKPIEQAHEQQKRFTADVSHELRTPLTAIKMESEVALLNSKSSSKELRDTLTSNLEEVNKLEHLINNLLRLTKLEAEELAEHFQTTTDKIVMDEAVDRVAKSASSRSVVIKKEIKANSAIAIDPESWSQLLVILLDNAIKYSPKKSNVVIKSYKKDNRVVFEVIDNGIGIEEKSLDHVFDRFYRAESSRNKDDSGGYGLGLSIAKMIADIHKTSIVLTTQPSHGTKASVSLPIIKRSTK